MHYYSTSNSELKFGLKEALFKGLGPDRGLFIPSPLPLIGRRLLESFRDTDLTGIAVSLSDLLFGEDIPPEDLHTLVEEAVNFDTPLVQVDEEKVTN